MENGNYNKISGRKTLVLVTIIIGLIFILTVYSVFLIFRKTSVLTNSMSIEKPVKLEQISKTPTASPKNPIRDHGMPTRFGD